MVPAATLKVFEPLAAFEPEERGEWERAAADPPPPAPHTVLLSREHGLRGPTATMVAERRHAEIIERQGTLLVCPFRTKLRLLASVLAFRRSIPAEAVGAFMPADEVERAADELESLRAAHPGWRNHILESAWDVPLHWFVAFDDGEREVVRTERRPSIRYETVVRAARERCARALEVVRATLPNPAVVAPIAGLERWLEDFEQSGLLMLDYGGIGRLVAPGELVRDRTCREIWASIRALAEGDGDRAAAHYMVVAEHWSGLRRRESLN